MSQVIWKSIFALTIVSGILGCNKTPRQYSGSYKPLEVSNDLSNVPNRKAWENPDVLSNDTNSKLTQEQIVEQIRKNSSQPVVYKYGAGGINFSTEYIDSKSILAKPIYGPDSDGATLYDESLIIYWKANEPRTPDAIIIDTGYLGPIDLGLKDSDGNVIYSHIREEFAQVLASTELEDQFIKNLYLVWEKIEDKNYNCLAQNSCLIDRNSSDKYVIMQLPQATLLFTNDDRKSLFRIVLVNESPLGVLNNNVELLSGKIKIPSDFDLPGVSDEERPKEIGIGDLWSKFLKLLGVQTGYYVQSNSFLKAFSGVNVLLSKSQYEREYREPSTTEKAKSILFGQEFRKSILIGGKQWMVHLENNNNVILTEGCEQGSVKNESEMSECLSTKLSILAQNTLGQKDFLRKLVILILSEKLREFGMSDDSFQKNVLRDKAGVVSVENQQLHWAFTGFETQESGSSYQATVSSENSTEKEAWSYSIKVSEETGVIQYIVSKSDEDIELKYFNQQFKDIDLKSNSIGGFRLGDKVYVNEVDLGRSEATVLIKDENGKLLKSRISYSEDQSLQVYFYEKEKIKLLALVLDTAGVGGVSLGLTKVGQEDIDNSLYNVMEVNYIGSGVKGKSIKGLCDSDDVKVDFLMPLSEFPAVLKKLKTSLSAKGKSCLYEAPLDKDGSGLNLEYFFPKQRVVMSFDDTSDSGFDRELISVGIYKKPGETVKGEEK